MQLIKLYHITCGVPRTRCWLPLCAELLWFATSARNCFVTYFRTCLWQVSSAESLHIFICVKPLSHNWFVSQTFVTCGYLPCCGNGALVHIQASSFPAECRWKCHKSSESPVCVCLSSSIVTTFPRHVCVWTVCIMPAVVLTTRPPHLSAEVKKRVGLYLHSPSGPSWPVMGAPLRRVAQKVSGTLWQWPSSRSASVRFPPKQLDSFSPILLYIAQLLVNLSNRWVVGSWLETWVRCSLCSGFIPRQTSSVASSESCSARGVTGSTYEVHFGTAQSLGSASILMLTF